MNANDKTEKVLREIHIMLSKAEPYKPEPSRVIINKQQMIDLLAELNKCIYAMQDEYELTEQSRNHAEREFRKKGDQIVWDASRKAEDVYAASVIYTDEALSRVRDIINDTNESLEKLCKNMKDKIAEQEKIVKTNQYELKGQLQDLSDTEKYLKIIDDRNKEIERQKNAGKPVEERTIDNEEKSIYANRQTEIKVNMDYIRKLGLAEGEDLGDGVVGEVKLADDTPDAGLNHGNDKDEAKEIVEAIEIYLMQEGYNVEKAYDGIQAVEIMKNKKIDLMIIDVMMPKLDGIRATLQIRKESRVPIIILSAKTEDADKILGLNVGADDYVTKPFNPLELVARVKSQLRRYTTLSSNDAAGDKVYEAGGLLVNDDLKKVTVDGEEVKLTPIEYNILLLLLKNKGKVYSINEIYESIWNEEAIGADNTVAVHIRHIREKLEINPKEPRYLKVVWGVGYKIEDNK